MNDKVAGLVTLSALLAGPWLVSIIAFLFVVSPRRPADGWAWLAVVSFMPVLGLLSILPSVALPERVPRLLSSTVVIVLLIFVAYSFRVGLRAWYEAHFRGR